MASPSTTKVDTVDDAIAAMRSIDATLPDDDGVKWFNLLYLRVTEAVRADSVGWEDWPFLQRFDVVFARLYFDALHSFEDGPARTPRAWRPLLDARRDRARARLQFALAGMNAHINNDLVIALNTMAEAKGHFPARDGARFRDFARVNDILEDTEASLRPVLARGLLGAVDVALGDLDSLAALWKVRKARQAAWANGEVCWHLRDLPHLRSEFLARLDRMVGLAGRGLMLPRLGLSEGAR